MRPARRLLGGLLALALLALLLGVLRLLGGPSSSAPLLAAALLLGGCALGDALALRRTPSPRLQRLETPTLYLQRHATLAVQLENPGRRSLRGSLFDHLPASLHAQGLPQRCQLPAHARMQLRIAIQPQRRGEFPLSLCEWRQDSPLGLWQQRRLLDLPGHLQVHPALTAQTPHALPWPLQRAGASDRQHLPRAGDGSDFLQLRELRDDDNPARIDWKTSARLGRPMVREYHQPSTTPLWLALDGGRAMASRDGEQSLLDPAIASLLQLARLSLRQGDAVGLLTLPDNRALPPARGAAQLQPLTRQLRFLQPSPHLADYAVLRERLLEVRRRSLLVLLGSFAGEVDDGLLHLAQALRGRHRLLLVDLRPPLLDRLLHEPVDGEEQALTYSGARLEVQARQRHLARLRASGAQVLESTPDELAARLLAAYRRLRD